jgi:hypothetical protein
MSRNLNNVEFMIYSFYPSVIYRNICDYIELFEANG